MHGLLALGVFVISTVSNAFVVNTNGRPLINNGRSPLLGNLQGYDPVSAEQQGGSPNFQQPNVLTGQKVQIQVATSKPVFSGVFGQPAQCLPTPPNMEVPSGASQDLYNYYNQLHATSQPFPHRPQRHPHYESGIHYGSDHYGQYGNGGSNPQLNPIHQVTGTSGPLQIFQQPDHVPLSMQLTSQQGRPVYVNNNNHRPLQPQESSPLLGGLYGNQNGQQPPSGGPINQQQPYNPRTTRRPLSGPIGYQPINIGKRSVRTKRATNSNFDPNKVNNLSANGIPTGYQPAARDDSRLAAPSYFTDPFKFQMDQSNNPMAHGSGSRDQGVLAFSSPSFFLGGSKTDSTQGSTSQKVDIGVQTDGSASVTKHHGKGTDSSSGSQKQKEEVTSDSTGHRVTTTVSSSALSQGGPHGQQDAVNQGGLKATPSVQDVKPSSKNQGRLLQEVSTFDPNKVNQAPFNFFDPSSMMTSAGRGKRHTLWRREAGFDPSKMNAGSFQPSNMNAGSFDPNSVNNAKQNPSSHPPGHFDPSSMPSGSYNPAQGNAGQANPGSMQQPTQTQTPPGSNPSQQAGQTGSFDPSKLQSGSSFNPGSGGQFDPSEWSEFIGRK